MNNFNAHGYSVAEVAQILGVTPVTIRSYINNKKLEADVEGVIQKGRRRRIRITREQLAAFMKKQKGYYESNPLYQKLCGCSDDIAKKEEAPMDPFDEYAVSDISELSGAWSNKTKNSQKTLSMENTNRKEGEQTLTLSIDGRVSIGNISRSTMITVVSALLSDSNFNPSDIKIDLN
jgi:predicted transcriptional regulator